MANGGIFSGAAWSIISTLAGNVLSLVVLIVLARHLTPNDFGSVAFVVLFVEITSGVLLSGLPDALVRQKVWDDNLASSVFWANAGLGGALTVLAIGGTVLLWGAGLQDIALLVLALSPSFAIEALNSGIDAHLRFEFRFRDIAARQIVGTITGGISALIAVFCGFGVWSLIIQRISSLLAQSLMLLIASQWRPKLKFHLRDIRSITPYALHTMGVYALGQINIRGAEIVIGICSGTYSLGIYQIANRGLNLLYQVTLAPVQRVSLVSLSKIDGNRGIALEYVKIVSVLGVVILPIFFGMAVISKDFISIVFGNNWSESGLVMAVISLCALPNLIHYLTSPALSAAGKSRELLNYVAILTFSTIMVTIIGSTMGIIWIVVANTIRSYVCVPINLRVLNKSIGVPPLNVLTGLLPSASAASLMALITFVISKLFLNDFGSHARVAFCVLIGFFLYISILLIIGKNQASNVFKFIRTSIFSR